jgi:hypothetical protein
MRVLDLPLLLGGRLLIGTHLDESNYLTNEKQGTINKCDFDCV